ncbi:MFS transporter [Pontiella agarivorans]|uniref:MFS transporter n=1 Tax=Pontiella agarivorans TaxID=3038953 RepID=A0ABU5MYT6_9BACT|nr:MFS transporter [Pontiella agarivorans]MDZ8119342.1 MFS transporter [Pontiella agarivorans]
MLTDEQRNRAFRIIITTQCLGMLSAFLFQNGFYLNYFTKLGFSSSSFASLSALPSLFSVFLLLPFAFLSDRLGKLKLALIGQVFMVLSLMMMLAAGWIHAGLAMVVGSLLLFCLGGSLQGASWFALLNPIIPPSVRGRFFGRLRVTFMTVNILFTLAVAGMMKMTQSMWAFQVLIGVILVAHVLRYFTYARIPELEREDGETHKKRSFYKACTEVTHIPGFTQFNAYIFLITLFTAGIPIVFGLMQKDIFGFSEAQIMLAGNLFLAGNVAGCALGGRAVDRFGTKRVFLFTHLAYASTILFMLLRDMMPWTIFVHVLACTFVFSLVGAMAGVANTSEVLALIPATNKSLSTAVNMTLFNLGMALSGLIVSRLIEWHALAEEWKIGGLVFTDYDSILVGFAGLIVLMLATIGLVPKVVRNAQLMPGSGIPRP